MWIAFRIVFLLMIPNSYDANNKTYMVVNCFQNCIFTYDSQLCCLYGIWNRCCELLSELYFYLWFPTMYFDKRISYLLWIAFRIVFLLMIPNLCIFLYFVLIVVNCFQNCIFTYDSQLNTLTVQHQMRCELLSELYFYLWFPTLIRTSSSYQ